MRKMYYVKDRFANIVACGTNGQPYHLQMNSAAGHTIEEEVRPLIEMIVNERRKKNIQ